MIGLINQLNLTDIILLTAVLGVFLDRLADNRGWSRSSKVLRAENTDLLRRNGELEQTVERHTDTIAEQERRLISLEAKLEEVKARDQEAVLLALQSHEIHADARHQRMLEVLTSIRDQLASR